MSNARNSAHNADNLQLLIEFGCADLPSHWVMFLGRWLQTMIPLHPAMVQALTKLKPDRDSHNRLEYIAAPRRFGALLQYTDWQSPNSKVIHGPRQGAPDKALEGFVRKHGTTRDQLQMDGDVFCLVLKPPTLEAAFASAASDLISDMTSGKPWQQIAEQYCEQAPPATHEKAVERVTSNLAHFYPEQKVERNTWPQAPGEQFVRPVRWIACMVNDKVAPLQRFGCRAGSITYGHQSTRSIKQKFGKKIQLARAEDYYGALKRNGVVVRATERFTDAITDSMSQLHLTVTDPDFAVIPEELIATTLYSHLQATTIPTDCPSEVAFSTLVDMPEKNRKHWGETVTRGYERVVTARLKDTAFFVRQDLYESSDKKSEKSDEPDPEERFNSQLQKTIYIEGLGSQYDRFRAVRRISVYLAKAMQKHKIIRASDWSKFADDLDIAAEWAWRDLGSQSIAETPKASGVIAAEALKQKYADDAGKYQRLERILRNANHEFRFQRPDPLGAASPIAKEGIVWPDAPTAFSQSQAETLMSRILVVANSLYLVVGMSLLDRLPKSSGDMLGVRRAAKTVADFQADYFWAQAATELFALSVQNMQHVEAGGTEAAQNRFVQFLAARYSHTTTADLPSSQPLHRNHFKRQAQHHGIGPIVRSMLPVSPHMRWLRLNYSDTSTFYIARSLAPEDLASLKSGQWPNTVPFRIGAVQARTRAEDWHAALYLTVEADGPRVLSETGEDIKKMGWKCYENYADEDVTPAVLRCFHERIERLLGLRGVRKDPVPSGWLELVRNTATRCCGLTENVSAQTSNEPLESAEEKELEKALCTSHGLLADIDAAFVRTSHAMPIDKLHWIEKSDRLNEKFVPQDGLRMHEKFPSDAVIEAWHHLKKRGLAQVIDNPDLDLVKFRKKMIDYKMWELREFLRHNKQFKEVVGSAFDGTHTTDEMRQLLGRLDKEYKQHDDLALKEALGRITLQLSEHIRTCYLPIDHHVLLSKVDAMLRACYEKLEDDSLPEQEKALYTDLRDLLNNYRVPMDPIETWVLRFRVVGGVCLAAQKFFDSVKVLDPNPQVRARRQALTREVLDIIEANLGKYE